MDSVKFYGVVKVLENRMRECQLLSKEDFNKILYDDLHAVEHEELVKLVITLFDEHTRLTSVINDVSDLVTSSQKFSILFE